MQWEELQGGFEQLEYLRRILSIDADRDTVETPPWNFKQVIWNFGLILFQIILCQPSEISHCLLLTALFMICFVPLFGRDKNDSVKA